MELSFNQLFNRYKTYYISKYGESKFNTVCDKIATSSKIAKLNGLSIQKRMAPSEGDFGATIHEIMYFMFASTDTTALAEIVAISLWNSEINSIYGFCNDEMLVNKAQNVLKRWKINLPK